MHGGEGSVPLVVRTPSGSGTGAAAQHSQSLEAWLTHIPGLKVIQPATAYDVKGLLISAIADSNPIIVYEHKLLYKEKTAVPMKTYQIPLGEADIKREGDDITLVATGIMVSKALEAARILARERISIEVIDPRTLVPLDEQCILNSVYKTGRLLIVHEAVKRSGYGAEIASIIAEKAFADLKAPIKRLGGHPVPIPHNRRLEHAAIPQVENIMQAVKALLAKSSVN